LGGIAIGRRIRQKGDSRALIVDNHEALITGMLVVIRPDRLIAGFAAYPLCRPLQAISKSTALTTICAAARPSSRGSESRLTRTSGI
jgi:hypothetical protein